jgi:hypothetical protein
MRRIVPAVVLFVLIWLLGYCAFVLPDHVRWLFSVLRELFSFVLAESFSVWQKTPI